MHVFCEKSADKLGGAWSSCVSEVLYCNVFHLYWSQSSDAEASHPSPRASPSLHTGCTPERPSHVILTDDLYGPVLSTRTSPVRHARRTTTTLAAAAPISRSRCRCGLGGGQVLQRRTEHAIAEVPDGGATHGLAREEEQAIVIERPVSLRRRRCDG